MTATRAAANNINTSMAQAELAGMPADLREGRLPMSELHKVNMLLFSKLANEPPGRSGQHIVKPAVVFS